MNFNTVLRDKLANKLKENLIIENIIIEVIGNEVSLKGIVTSYEVKDKIEQLIVSFSEVQAVNNELAIFNEN
ncbi:BON domain-containing protein [Flavobacterium facile]|uniref:BON domain-containing protein n=1 Tax=Flavobacterium facile TaxID=2893174 RepID=UPI002E7A2D71|nr:BON domain-containing protein [Flavobacterium sp. T-12]